jgi:hypothetical protein
MSMSRGAEKVRWVVNCDPLTIEAVKTLAASGHYSIGYVLDMCVEYFSRKVSFDEKHPLKWYQPDDF